MPTSTAPSEWIETGVAEIFLVAAPMVIVAFIALWFLRGRILGTRSGIELSGSQERAR